MARLSALRTGRLYPQGMRTRIGVHVMKLREDGKVVSPRHRPPLPPGNASGTHFC